MNSDEQEQLRRELREVQLKRRLAWRQKRYSARQSRLDKFRAEIVSLRNEQASYRDLQQWLKTKRVSVSVSTIARWLQKNAPELR